MKEKALLLTGLIGTVVAALCCFTPILVILLGVVGVSALVGWLDYVLLPAPAVFAGITIYALWRKQTDNMTTLQSTITCPRCGHPQAEIMPTDACQFYYDCRGCGALLRPEPGDCCVYCSYGSARCPSMQDARKSQAEGNCCATSWVGA